MAAALLKVVPLPEHGIDAGADFCVDEAVPLRAPVRAINVPFVDTQSSIGGARVQSDDHHVQANLPAANTTTHTIRNKNIETARLACFLNSLRPSFTRVVRWK